MKLLYPDSKKKSSKGYKVKLYDSLDELPVKIWMDIFSTGNRSLLIKEGKCEEYLIDMQWHKLFNEYLKHFGLPSGYEEFLRVRRKIADNQIKYIETEDGIYKTWVDLGKKEIEHKIKNTEKGDYRKTITAMQKFYGFRINPSELSVFEYYSNLRYIEETVSTMPRKRKPSKRK